MADKRRYNNENYDGSYDWENPPVVKGRTHKKPMKGERWKDIYIDTFVKHYKRLGLNSVDARIKAHLDWSTRNTDARSDHWLDHVNRNITYGEGAGPPKRFRIDPDKFKENMKNGK